MVCILVPLVLAVVAGSLAWAVWHFGNKMPAGHMVARSVQLHQPPQAVWDVVRDFANAPGWNFKIEAVERLPDRDGHEVWQEKHSGGPALQLEVVEDAPPARLVRSIVSTNVSYAGRWEFGIEPADAGSRVTLVEHSEIPNPYFRFIFRAFMNPAVHLENYLKALAVKFGEPETPVREPAHHG